MGRYAIYAYDKLNEGRNGIYTRMIVDVDDFIEVIDIAEHESLYIIDTHIEIHDELYDRAKSEYEDQEEKVSTVEEFYDLNRIDDVAYDIWYINESLAGEYTTNDLVIKFNDDPNDFIDRFCEEF